MNYGNVAAKLIEKNRDKSGRKGTSVLEKAVISNDRTSQYKAVAQHIDSKLCGIIGRAEGFYVDKRKLVWDIIDTVNEVSGEGLTY